MESHKRELNGDKKMKILLLCASSNSVRNFRISLIKKLKQEGVQVGVCVFDNENEELIKSLGVDYFCLNTSNRLLNPIGLIKLEKEYISLIKEYNPDIVFTFALKPAIYPNCSGRSKLLKLLDKRPFLEDIKKPLAYLNLLVVLFVLTFFSNSMSITFFQ